MTMTPAHRRATAVLRGEDLPVVEMECDEDGLAHRALTAALNDPDDPDWLAKVIDDAALMRTGRSIGILASADVADAVRAAILGPSRG